MRLNEQAVRKIEAPPAGYLLIRDDEIPGLGLRVTANDARSFTLTYTIEGRQRRLTIGAWPAWTATAARERAKELRRQIDRGEDPLEEKQARRGAPTFKEIAEEYLARHAVHKRSGNRDREYLTRDVLPAWGARNWLQGKGKKERKSGERTADHSGRTLLESAASRARRTMAVAR